MKTLETLDPRYRIRSPLRCDGVGSLDCAEDAITGARMAIRWLPVDANGVAAAQAVRQLPEHPVIPSIRDTGRIGQAAFVAMDFPDGEVLATRTGARMALPVVMRLGADLSDALASIHAQNVFHGELSADSVLLLGSNRAILWDLPLVLANRMTDRRGEERMLSQLIRTAAYLAPERARGGLPSAESDVFSLGAILCLLLGGQPPKAPSTLDLLHRIATGQWRPEVPSELPAYARTLLQVMISDDPADRPTAAVATAALGKAGAVERPVESETDPLLGERLEALLAESLPAALHRNEPALEPTDPLLGERLVPMLEAMKSGDAAVNALPLPSVMVDATLTVTSPPTATTGLHHFPLDSDTYPSVTAASPAKKTARRLDGLLLGAVALFAITAASAVAVFQLKGQTSSGLAPLAAEVTPAATAAAPEATPSIAPEPAPARAEAVPEATPVANEELTLEPLVGEGQSVAKQSAAATSRRPALKKQSTNAKPPAPSELKRPQL